MIVTFISQCEKKAHARTRKVLDAFANRIGDNTWQTVITEDGLAMVKRLLLQTASKNTAVSCYRFHTRKHSELVWIVGNRNKFNEWGWVPVNYTSKEMPMDLPIKTSEIYANSHGQPLSQHLFAVGFVAYHLLKRLNISEKVAQSAFIAGILHDIGKIDKEFQVWLNKKMDKNKDVPLLLDDGVHINGSDRGFNKFSFENHPRHHEISWILALSLLNDDKALNASQHAQIYHAIYWHHTRPYRHKNEQFFETSAGIDKLLKDNIKDIYAKLNAILQEVNNISDYFKNQGIDNLLTLPHFNNNYQLINHDTPTYKNYSKLNTTISEIVQEIKPNSLNNLVRMAVIVADRCISAMSADDLNEYLAEASLEQAVDRLLLSDDNQTLQEAIDKCMTGFDKKYPNSERNIAQHNIAKELAQIKQIAKLENSHNISILQGPAGCGKTKIALEWAFLTNAKQIIWVCPRVQVCLGLLHDLTQYDYLPHSRIEIFTGEYKKIMSGDVDFVDTPETEACDYFTGDIVITTIDQVVNNIVSHQKITGMLNFMQSHVVFDEFHEIINIPALNLLFAELIEAKKLRGDNADVLLVSATPHDYFVQHVLNIDKANIVRMPSFNTAKYKLTFNSYDEKKEISPLINKRITDDKTTFIIHNTAQDAQLGFLLHQDDENNILLHSKYTRQDKKHYFDKVFDSFREHGSRAYQILRSGPIVQASLNISCERMYGDFTSAENYLQRLGRLDRFGENSAENIYTIVYPKSFDNNKQTNHHHAQFLAQLNIWQSSLAWFGFLRSYLADKGSDMIELNELYQVYQAFYADKSCQEKIESDITKALIESQQLINKKVIDPFSTPSKSKQNSVMKIASTSLRGDNRFVQLAVCMVDNQLAPTFIDEYAYDENTDHSQVVIGLTESVDRMLGGRGRTQDRNKNLVDFMASVHETIMQNKAVKVNKIRNESELLILSRSPEHPIYLSYTPSDLKAVNRTMGHDYAVYYVKTGKQNVGMLSFHKLTNPFNIDEE